MNPRHSPTRRALWLLAATLASLLVTVFAGYAARSSLLEANKWIKHTDEVKLAIDQCKLALAHQDPQALDEAEARVRALTADNPREQRRLMDAQALAGNGSVGALDEVFADMQHDEDSLMVERMRRATSARKASLAASLLGGLLTVGFAVGWLAFVRGQLQDRRQAEERLHLNEERFHGLVDAVTDYAIFMLDADGRVATWNPGAERTKGYSSQEIIGKPFALFYPQEDRAAGTPEKVLEIVRREGRFEGEGWRVRKDGSRFWAHVVITALRGRGGEIMGFAKVARDLTAQRAAQQTERNLVRETLARQEMERVNRAKDEFVATMSHELRTPLTAISGWATILRRKPRQEEKLERGLEVIERNAKAQTRMVNDLLDVSRIISGKFQIKLQKTEVSPPISAAADVVRPAAEAKGVRLVVDIDPQIGATLADADRLQQIVWNLLSNAVRFTPRGGRVKLNAARSASEIVIRVEDTGIGIAREYLPRVFERFMQVDSSTTRIHGGLGLGLAIVRHLVEAHGGDVEAFSEGIGRGASFTVTLPIRAVSEERPETEAQEAVRVGPLSADLKDVRVLVVEDDVDSLEVLRIVLETAGAQVTVTTSARMAFEVIDTGRPFDLIISDIGLPDVDGYAFIRRVRSQTAGAHVPAIALTAYARSEDAELAKSAGYQEHLSKPVDEGLLLRTAATWSGHLVGMAAT